MTSILLTTTAAAQPSADYWRFGNGGAVNTENLTERVPARTDLDTLITDLNTCGKFTPEGRHQLASLWA